MATASSLEFFVAVRVGHFVVVRSCACCDWFDSRPRKIGTGRSTGFVLGNQQRGRAIEHVRTCEGVRAALLKAGA